MAMPERVPERRDTDRDERFRMTARLLPAALVTAASALLAGDDDERAVPVVVRLPVQAAVPSS